MDAENIELGDSKRVDSIETGSVTWIAVKKNQAARLGDQIKKLMAM